VFSVFPKTLGQPRGVNNDPIMLKFGTLVDWMNIWGYFLFFENFPFWALRTRFSLKLRGSLEK